MRHVEREAHHAEPLPLHARRRAHLPRPALRPGGGERAEHAHHADQHHREPPQRRQFVAPRQPPHHQRHQRAADQAAAEVAQPVDAGLHGVEAVEHDRLPHLLARARRQERRQEAVRPQHQHAAGHHETPQRARGAGADDRGGVAECRQQAAAQRRRQIENEIAGGAERALEVVTEAEERGHVSTPRCRTPVSASSASRSRVGSRSRRTASCRCRRRSPGDEHADAGEREADAHPGNAAVEDEVVLRVDVAGRSRPAPPPPGRRRRGSTSSQRERP